MYHIWRTGKSLPLKAKRKKCKMKFQKLWMYVDKFTDKRKKKSV